MKIRKIKVSLSLKEVYAKLRNIDIKLTDEIEALVSITSKKVSDYIDLSVIFDTFDLKKFNIEDFKKYTQIPKNAINISFICVTLGAEIEKLFFQEESKLKKDVLQVVIDEYIDSANRFVLKILEDQQDSYQLGSVFNLPKEFNVFVYKMLDLNKIGVSLDNNDDLLPKFTSIKYLFWFDKKK